MHLINTCKRLITLSHDSGEKVERIKLMPAGESVNVPDAVAKSAYVQALINDGSLAVAADKSATANGLSEIKAQAKELGINVGSKWSEDKIKIEIEKALGK